LGLWRFGWEELDGDVVFSGLEVEVGGDKDVIF
jgi:hypothetical protein